MALRVSELAARVGTSADTVRYYEKVSLLPEPDRTPSGYRLYAEEAADRLRFIRGAQRLGLKLRGIRELLLECVTGDCTPAGTPKSSTVGAWRSSKRRMARLAETRKEFVRAGGGKQDGP